MLFPFFEDSNSTKHHSLLFFADIFLQMSEELITLLCGQWENRRFRSPIPLQIIPAVHELEAKIATFPANTHFIIYYCGQPDLSSQVILTSLSHQKNIDIVVTGNGSLDNSLITRNHRLNLSEDLPVCKSVLYGIRAYRSMSEHSGVYFENEAKKLLTWLINYFQVRVSIDSYLMNTDHLFILAKNVSCITHSIE